MHQTSSETEHQHYLPTTFAEDNLVYKFLDSNLLAVSVMSDSTGVLELYILNGVTGKIVYKFSEQNVAPGEAMDMMLSENYFLLTFKRASRFGGLPQQVLTTTEFYQDMEEKDTLKLLKDKFINKAPRLSTDEYASAHLETPIVV